MRTGFRLPAALRASVGLHLVAALAAPTAWHWAVGAVVLNHGALTAAGMWPRGTWLGPNLHRLPATGRGEIALTFDDGPDPVVTPIVLDLLDRHAARASFFCIGARARAYPELTREIVRRGHSVENHTDRHMNRFAALSLGGMRREVGTAQASLAELAGAAPAFFRAPMGLRSPLLQPVLASHGLRLVSWTRRALDGWHGDPAAAAQRLRVGLRPGDVLLLHDGRAARGPDGRAVVLTVLPDLLQALAARGLRSVTLAEGMTTRPAAA